MTIEKLLRKITDGKVDSITFLGSTGISISLKNGKNKECDEDSETYTDVITSCLEENDYDYDCVYNDFDDIEYIDNIRINNKVIRNEKITEILN